MNRTLAALAAIIGFLLWAHLASGVPVFDSQVESEPGWERFRVEYGINYFGEDGQFVRAVQNGYNLFFHTHKYATRFTRKRAGDGVNSAADATRQKSSPIVSSTRTASIRSSAGGFHSRIECVGAMPPPSTALFRRSTIPLSATSAFLPGLSRITCN